MYQKLNLISYPAPRESNWKALVYFNIYRFLVAFLFVSLYWVGQLPDPLGKDDSALFSVAAHIYLFISIVLYLFSQLKKPPYISQVISHVLSDIIVIILLMNASAGINSGFGMLLVITVAGGSILTPGKIGILYAAIAAIAVLGHEVYIQLNQVFFPPNYTHAGFLGITFFLTAFVSNILSGKVEQSEKLAEQRAIDLENLAILNDHIVRRLQSGIMVIDEGFKIILLNDSAKSLLNIDKNIRNTLLVDHFPELTALIGKWLDKEGERTVTLKSGKVGFDCQASFSKISHGRNIKILIFLDDVLKLRQRAQQLKLASLGRLAASIAHEIRNPLGAISHASQLLSEAETLGHEDRHLISIIEDHSNRVNNIIENIMLISRREQSVPITIELNGWLEAFRDEFIMQISQGKKAMKILTTNKSMYVRMDPDQLHQVVWNLCENAVRYSRNEPFIEIRAAVKIETKRPYLDIEDNGPGIEASIEDHVFEPFYTTSAKGSGLGLYIARELCEANQASLTLHSNTDEGCCFRINFSHPDKQHILE